MPKREQESHHAFLCRLGAQLRVVAGVNFLTWRLHDRQETGAVLTALRAIIGNSVKTHLHDLAFRVARDEGWPDHEQSSIDELLRDFASKRDDNRKLVLTLLNPVAARQMPWLDAVRTALATPLPAAEPPLAPTPAASRAAGDARPGAAARRDGRPARHRGQPRSPGRLRWPAARLHLQDGPGWRRLLPGPSRSGG